MENVSASMRTSFDLALCEPVAGLDFRVLVVTFVHFDQIIPDHLLWFHWRLQQSTTVAMVTIYGNDTVRQKLAGSTDYHLTCLTVPNLFGSRSPAK